MTNDYRSWGEIAFSAFLCVALVAAAMVRIADEEAKAQITIECMKQKPEASASECYLGDEE